jgi:hypothetical protein
MLLPLWSSYPGMHSSMFYVGNRSESGTQLLLHHIPVDYFERQLEFLSLSLAPRADLFLTGDLLRRA